VPADFKLKEAISKLYVSQMKNSQWKDQAEYVGKVSKEERMANVMKRGEAEDERRDLAKCLL
jgi:hypothetical protein